MLRNVITSFILIGIWLFLSAGNTMKSNSPEPFKIKKAYYQPWLVSNDEKGTDIILILNRVEKGVDFDSIVFRDVRLKAFVTRVNNDINIKSILTSGKSRIKIASITVNLPDQLIYHFNGERIIYPLTTIERKATKVFKIK